MTSPTSAQPDGASAHASGRPVFTERLGLGPGGWFGVFMFALVMGIALSVVDGVTAVVVGVVTFAVGAAVAWWTAPVVSVSDGVLQAGRARIPLSELGEVVVLDREGMREQMGTGWDARAYACLRTWAGGGVRVEVTDPADPTPFWVVSSRRADDLAAAITGR